MMDLILWLVVAWVGGIAAILGSLMILATVLLWSVPASSKAAKKAGELSAERGNRPWQNHLKLLGVSIAIALVGFSLLLICPFPMVYSAR